MRVIGQPSRETPVCLVWGDGLRTWASERTTNKAIAEFRNSKKRATYNLLYIIRVKARKPNQISLTEHDWRIVNGLLANQVPLGAEFQAVWDANLTKLYEA